MVLWAQTYKIVSKQEDSEACIMYAYMHVYGYSLEIHNVQKSS